MKLNIILLALFISVTLLSCDKCIKGSGSIITVERSVPSFNKINVKGDFKLFIRQDNTQKVEVSADDNIAAMIETKVINGELIISLDHNRCIKKNTIGSIYVSIPALERVNLSGSGEIRSQNTLTGNSLEVILDGSGLIQINAEYDNINGRLNGSGNMTLIGEANNGNFRLEGSGYLNAGNLKCKNADAALTGSGNLNVYAEDNLKAKLTGSGRIGYYGNPVVDANVTGSGSIGKN